MVIPHDSVWSVNGIDFNLHLRFATMEDLTKIVELNNKLDDENLKHYPFINEDVKHCLVHLTEKEIEDSITWGSYLVVIRTHVCYTNVIKEKPYIADIPENDIIAFAKIIFNDGVMDISEIMIDNNHYVNRNLGIGKYIVRKCLELAKERKCGIATLGVHTNNSIAKHIYESNGFKTYHESMYLKLI